MLEQQKKETEKLRALEVDGKIYFDKLPVLEPRIREILLKWLSDAMESADFSARTDDGRRYILDRSQAGENCVVHCEDGNFTMPEAVNCISGGSMMKELEVLLSKRWILKSRDKEMYYKLRDALGELRKFTTEKMGCQIIDNSLLIKMEKIPVIPESFMGIMKFSSKEEYAYLCMLLMYLEDRDAQEQFILSQLTEYITANLPGDISDWTLYTNRRKLIRVLRFAVEQGIVGITDGKDEAFMDDEAGEVLYENTGASRYFMKSFSKGHHGIYKAGRFSGK